jgi:heterodisulfide reductase subunit C
MRAVESDPAFLADVRKFGRFVTNACLQCGGCTLSCNLTSRYTSFPRRTIRYALPRLPEVHRAQFPASVVDPRTRFDLALC